MASGSHLDGRIARVLTAVLATLIVAGLAPISRAGAALYRVGRQPVAPPGATDTGAVAPGLALHVTVTLKPRNPEALAAYARAVSTPGSAAYHAYLTPSQFARRFGATAAHVQTVRQALRSRGLRSGPVSAGSLSIPVTATAGQLERAFSLSLHRLALRGRRTAIAASSAPALAASAASAVQAVVGLNTTSVPRPLLARARPALSRSARSSGATGPAGSAGPQPCPQAQQASTSPYGQGAHTVNQLASAYQFSGLYAAGDTGAGVTVAVYELEPNDPGDIAAYQACYGTHASVSYFPVDGGAGTGPGAGEAALDIENTIGFAPGVHVLVYQGPNSNSGAPGSGPYDTFSKIISQDRARVVTVSWGQCEPTVGQADAIAENTLFQQATVQGQSIVAADGDTGAQDCDTGGTPPQTQPAVDDPSSQPYVTGVGGTTLSALGPRPAESVWNSGGMPLSATVQPGASGGGVSSFWPMPAAQLDAASILGVRSPSDASAACGNSGGYCRAVPDVSADADPSTGYLVYWNGSGSVAGQPAGWQGIGGTSGAAPVWAALLALADASPACAGSPIGFANPALYRSAGAAYTAVFNDVTAGNNDFTGTNGGRYAAKVGYDPVSGLGTPNATALAGQLCANSLHLSTPASERTTVHARVSLRLHATDAPGAQVTYGATGLPPGITLNPATGRISGSPTRTGRHTVRLTARDGEQSAASATLAWTVGGAPQISRLSLTPAAHGGADLAFTVSSDRNAPALQTIAVTLPAALRLVHARHGVSVKTTARKPSRLAFTDSLTRARTITIRLREAIASLRITLAPPTLRQVGGRVATSVRSGRRLAVSISVIDAAAGNSHVAAKVSPRR
ncbi:MAG TPA: protease pro-enzyme activation domain-containing protein [Solirubrobacteraceae bacterium]|nr:protease pro-enzyme activation domain-containing protein [Solirubrobacteraceae bacterium]